MYADDILLLSASLWDLQRMIDVCSIGKLPSLIDMVFNAKKSQALTIGHGYRKEFSTSLFITHRFNLLMNLNISVGILFLLSVLKLACITFVQSFIDRLMHCKSTVSISVSLLYNI